MSDFYALLIGIDYYEPNSHYKSLQGAVGDIDSVGDYLEKSLKIPSDKITRLTSPLPDTNSLADVRSARQEESPTYVNIIDAFKDITKHAKIGDLVYIHYSGHGFKAKTIYPELEKFGKGQLDEGIVPMDFGSNGRYLRDVEIATLLKMMTDKGLIVTLVFDSCHSGGATRGEDVAIRGSETVDLHPRLEESLVADRNILIENWLELTNTGDQDSWLPNNNNYVFLAACSPNEFAYEYAVEGKKRRGALTYWMIDTLNSSASKLTYQSLFNRVKCMIQSRFRDQLPMLIGKGNRLVFGDYTVATPLTILLADVNADQTQVTLDAGAASGLREETRLAIYPFNTADFSNKQRVLAVVEITEVEADRSVAKVLSVEDGGIGIKGKLELSLPAMILSLPTTLIHRVRLYNEKIEGKAENQIPANLVKRQDEALEKVRRALADNGWIKEVEGNEKADYQVAVGREGEYEICIGMPLKNLGSPLMIDDPDAPAKVVKRLIHLAKYQTAEEIDNPESELFDDIEYELLDAKTKKPFDDLNNICLKSGNRVYVRIKNTSSQPLSVAVLNFLPTWGISQIPILGDHSPFFVLQPSQNTETRIRFEVPEKEDNKQLKETLKLFVTRGAANFQWLKLPPINEEWQTKGDLNQELQLKIEAIAQESEQEATTRGIENPKIERFSVNPLNKLLSIAGADLNNPPELTRASYDPDPNAEWLTTSIQVTVEKII